MANDETPKNAGFVGHVVTDAKNPPETRMLTGWLGESGEEGHTRLYTDAELSAYVDIPADAILYTEPIRDVQPSGGVFVWIKRDAELKSGGSAAGRAARFLQGQVQHDYASAANRIGTAQDAESLKNVGFRCVTQVPCGEPTGFTGQCTKQPEVGGAWPCITAIPHCFEPTGFTGKCTHQPWPNPSQYVLCTVLHCPTNDLTHIPYICNIIATGIPGCPIIDLPQEGDPAREESAERAEGVEGGDDAERAALPLTSLPGCGYTKSWGVCQTHLLGCGFTKNWGPHCPAQAPAVNHTPATVCTQHGCQGGEQAANPTSATVCTQFGCQGGGFAARPADVTVIIFTRQPGCNLSAVDACPSRLCETVAPTQLCTQFAAPNCPTPATTCTQVGAQCPTACGAECQSQQVHCTSMGPICLTHPVECTQSGQKCPSVPGVACPTNPPAGCASVVPPCPVIGQTAQGFAVGTIGPTGYFGCTQSGPQCRTYPNGDCTFFGGCVAGAGGPAAFGAINTPAPVCIPVTVDACLSRLCETVAPTQLCTQFAEKNCPTPATTCTQVGAQCPTACGADCQSQQVNCTSMGPVCLTHPVECTQSGPKCPTMPGAVCPSRLPVACPTHPCVTGPAGCHTVQAAACQTPPAQAFAERLIGPTGFLGCTQFAAKCPTQPNGDCTFFGCPSIPQFAAAGPGAGCTQSGPQCHTHLCTLTAPQCPNTLPPHCPHPTPLCPPASGFQCPSALGCQSIACQSIACQPGGGGGEAFAQHAQPAGLTFPPQCPHTHLLCPTGGVDCTVVCTHIGVHCPPTPATVCTQTGPQCPHTLPPHCPPLTPACPTVPGPHCPPPTFLHQLCPVTLGGPHCPPASGFQCPSALDCPSIACQSFACQSLACHPGGGGGELPFAHEAQAALPRTFATVCTQFPPCPTAFCPHSTALCHTPLCPHPTALCPHPTPLCHTPLCPLPTPVCPTALCQVQRLPLTHGCTIGVTACCPPTPHCLTATCPTGIPFHCAPSFVFCAQ